MGNKKCLCCSGVCDCEFGCYHNHCGEGKSRLAQKIVNKFGKILLDKKDYDFIEDFENEEEIKENFSELLDENPQAWFLLYLYEKDYLTKEQVKEVLKGKEWKTSCYGDYINRLRKDFSLIINKEVNDEP